MYNLLLSFRPSASLFNHPTLSSTKNSATVYTRMFTNNPHPVEASHRHPISELSQVLSLKHPNKHSALHPKPFLFPLPPSLLFHFISQPPPPFTSPRSHFSSTHNLHHPYSSSSPTSPHLFPCQPSHSANLFPQLRVSVSPRSSPVRNPSPNSQPPFSHFFLSPAHVPPSSGFTTSLAPPSLLPRRRSCLPPSPPRGAASILISLPLRHDPRQGGGPARRSCQPYGMLRGLSRTPGSLPSPSARVRSSPDSYRVPSDGVDPLSSVFLFRASGFDGRARYARRSLASGNR